MKTVLLIVLLIVILSVAAYVGLRAERGDEALPEITGTPTNFVEAGTVVINNPGLKPGVPYLLYENPGEPAVTKELVFDALSACVLLEVGTVPCETVDASLDLHGKRVIVEGNEADGVLLVRKLRLLFEGEVALIYDPGRIFITWQEALQLI